MSKLIFVVKSFFDHVENAFFIVQAKFLSVSSCRTKNLHVDLKVTQILIPTNKIIFCSQSEYALNYKVIGFAKHFTQWKT